MPDWKLLAKIIGGMIGVIILFVSVFAIPIYLSSIHPLLGLVAFGAIIAFGLPFYADKPSSKWVYLRRVLYCGVGTAVFFGLFIFLVKLSIEYPLATLYTTTVIIVISGIITLGMLVHLLYTEAKGGSSSDG